MNLRFFLIFFVISSYACNETEKVEKQESKVSEINKFHNATIREIYNLLDHQQGDSLSKYLSHVNADYRAEAALAFATLQDTAFLDQLFPLLNDVDAEVQKNAAWAIGQAKNHRAIKPLLNALPTISSEAETNLIEAIGKCATKDDCSFFENFELTNSNALGFSKGVYHLVYKKILPQAVLDKISSFFSSAHNEDAKLFMAATIARANPKDLTALEPRIESLIHQEKNPEIVLQLIGALGKITSKSSKEFLANLLEEFNNNIPDYRVIVATLKAYTSKKKTDWKILKPFLNHPNENITTAVAQGIANSNFNYKKNKISSSEFDSFSPKVKAIILGYGLKTAKTKNKLIQNIQYLYRNSANYTEKSYFMKALRFDKKQATWLEEKMINEGHPLLKTTAAEALVAMKEDHRLPKGFNFTKTILEGIKTNDIGVIATFAIHLRNEKMAYKGKFNYFDELTNALNQLQLPKDIETYNELSKTKAYLSGEKTEIKSNQFNHPLNWNLIRKIPKKQTVTVLTEKGKLTIQLDVESSPGSVSNFIELCQKGFFDGKIFHRVVPNFVVQTGCPRGDGYGSLNYSIRSEFALHNYATGAVGMASAGKNTENCQWFITHIPTPFLEGRYTIIGYVMDEDLLTLHQIKRGDKIISVKLNGLNID